MADPGGINDRLLGDIPASTPLKTSVRRLTKRPTVIGMAFVMVGVFAAYLAIVQAGRVRGQSDGQVPHVPVSSQRMVDDMLASQPDGIIGDANARMNANVGQAAPDDNQVTDAATVIPEPDPFDQEIQKAIEAERMRIARARREEATKAVLSQSAVQWTNPGNVVQSQSQTHRRTPDGHFGGAQPLASSESVSVGDGYLSDRPHDRSHLARRGGEFSAALVADRSAALSRAQGSVFQLGQAADYSDVNRQDLKRSFREGSERSVGAVLNERRVGAAGRFEVKAGNVIPSVLITSINSDLPGQLVAQVSQNVLDSTHAQAVLIPQGARLIGRYDSDVTYGQERALVVWDRLIFPDGSHLSLRGMSGHDRQGAAGFADRVNNHYARVFGSAILLSFVQGAIATTDSSSASANPFSFGVPTPGEELRRALALEVGRVSTELIRKNLRIAPTLEIRPGYRFAVMVNKDIVLPPYAPMQALLRRRGER